MVINIVKMILLIPNYFFNLETLGSKLLEKDLGLSLRVRIPYFTELKYNKTQTI